MARTQASTGLGLRRLQLSLSSERPSPSNCQGSHESRPSQARATATTADLQVRSRGSGAIRGNSPCNEEATCTRHFKNHFRRFGMRRKSPHEPTHSNCSIASHGEPRGLHRAARLVQCGPALVQGRDACRRRRRTPCGGPAAPCSRLSGSGGRWGYARDCLVTPEVRRVTQAGRTVCRNHHDRFMSTRNRDNPALKPEFPRRGRDRSPPRRTQ
jgi:hypothetical protein